MVNRSPARDLGYRVYRDDAGFLRVVGIPGMASVEREVEGANSLAALLDGRPEVIVAEMHPRQEHSRLFSRVWASELSRAPIAAIAFVGTDHQPIFRMAVSAVALGAGHRVHFFPTVNAARSALGHLRRGPLAGASAA